MMELILGIETSCDETAAAVLKNGDELLSNVVASQDDIHSKYGGIVPELACRRHIECILPVIEKALDDANVKLKDIQGIAVTKGPGLIGSILIGVSAAKSIAFSLDIPFIGVNHIEGHLNAVYLDKPEPTYPHIALIASGGHSSLFLVRDFGNYTLLARTRDDAAGEAFDKVAKMLDYPQPGGPSIEKSSIFGNPKAYDFPRGMIKDESLDFSFSGLKTAVMLQLKNNFNAFISEQNKADIAASFQQAVIDTLIIKTLRAVDEYNISNLVVAGGVAANNLLRQSFNEESLKKNFNLYVPSFEFCTDNAAMIAYVGHKRMIEGKKDGYDMEVFASGYKGMILENWTG
ncbi:tRNA (adenosine(37)-N6)-threonylcarbamoyltransferase complex transferase subunit TsaD [bacterium]|nr:tRNA (adenosine(37)-N6)-threonylcarbamoyltransferase complex transferase subunit TsaD [bacterium]